jgi:hypothetical protein
MKPWPVSLVLSITLCALPPAGASGAGSRAGASPAAAAIESIVLERDCMGCRHGLRVELRRDGQALWALQGKARLRTADRQGTGRVDPAAFEALSRAVHEAAFFALADQYDDPQLADGGWSQLTVQRSGSPPKTVWRRESTGPAALLALEGAIEAWRARAGLGEPWP